MIYITSEPLSPQAVTDLVCKGSNGAVITFLGTTRDFSEGRDVLYLEYEAYQPMAENMLHQIVEEVRERWGIEDMAVAHRIGRLEVGEISLVVALASPHRKEAFEASQYAMDRIKEVVPIWKKEVFQGGEAWIGSPEEEATTPTP
ncbi:MAG: molybdenum cofactor biosynthesis protein MoaE [Dehalococcoidia bacterium]|jgi:molybdopterin synthase catalytic subunit|nr:molybdenum cofactor biosynthesis protein MoaE [Dehalococcoidia bacterium]